MRINSHQKENDVIRSPDDIWGVLDDGIYISIKGYKSKNYTRGKGFSGLFSGLYKRNWDLDLGLSEYRSFPALGVPGNSIRAEAMCLVCCFTTVVRFYMVKLQFLALNCIVWPICHPQQVYMQQEQCIAESSSSSLFLLLLF